jgi:DNA adenine methylase
VRSRSFGVSIGPARFDITRLVPLLEAVHERLASVTIECLPWSEFITRYDRPDTLFYLDPPYWGSEDDYGRGLRKRSDFGRLAEQLRGIEGRFLLSLNDVPEIRRIFGGFWMEQVATSYTVGIKGGEAGGALEPLIADQEPAVTAALLI